VAKKKVAKKKGARKAAPRRARKTAGATAPKPYLAATRDGKVTWQKDARQVVLTPLKAIIKEHIAALREVPQTDEVRKMVASLESTALELKSGCGLSMTVPRQ